MKIIVVIATPTGTAATLTCGPGATGTGLISLSILIAVLSGSGLISSLYDLAVSRFILLFYPNSH